MSEIQVFRTADGQFKGRLLDASGAIVPIRPGAVGGKRTAKARNAGRKAVQAMLKSVYERQQAGQSGN